MQLIMLCNFEGLNLFAIALLWGFRLTESMR